MVDYSNSCRSFYNHGMICIYTLYYMIINAQADIISVHMVSFLLLMFYL